MTDDPNDTSSTDTVWTLSIPVAGKRYLNLGRDASYQAAKRGLLPTIETGKGRKRVVVKVIERLLGAGE